MSWRRCGRHPTPGSVVGSTARRGPTISRATPPLTVSGTSSGRWRLAGGASCRSFCGQPSGVHERKRDMTLEDNKALVRRFIDEVFVDGRFDSVDELLSDDFVPHTWRFSGDGKADLKAAIERVSKGLSDPVFTIEDIIAEDD